MAETLQALEDTYETLSDQIDLLYAACQTPEQRDSLTAEYKQAHENYLHSRNKIFEDHDPEVAELTRELQQANIPITHAVETMGNISKVIDEITQAVKIGTSLMSKIVPV